jgi:Ser/Thr protein kinase RdoA (MazF antagonist)
MPSHDLHTIASAVLHRYPDQYRPERTEFLAGAGGFSGAVIVRVGCRVGDYCLRGWPPGSLPPRRILGLHRLLRTVLEQGVSQVSVPVAALDGSTLVASGDRLWQLEPWMPGRADFHENPSEERLRAAMICLAAWHRAAATFRPEAAEREWFDRHESAPSPAVRERFDLIRDWTGGGCERLRRAMRESAGRFFRNLHFAEFHEIGARILDLFSRKADRIAGELRAAAGLRFRLQPCLRDVWHDHLLFTGDEVTGLIDPSACRTENVAADLARLLGSLLGDDRSRWEIALRLYATHRRLTIDELGLVEILDRSAVLLSGLTWLDRHYLQGQTFNDPGRVVERMRGILRRLERLG